MSNYTSREPLPIRPLPADYHGNDPFETSINTAIERVEALRRVAEAQRAVKRAQFVLAHETAEAEKLGAFSLLPANQQPAAVQCAVQS